MKLIWSVSIIGLLLACSDSESPKRSSGVPTYLLEKPEEPLVIYYKIPDDIPLALAKAYMDYQALLTEEKWQGYLTQVKMFCDSEIDHNLLKLRVRLWYPEVYYYDGVVAPSRLPRFSRSIDDRASAYSFYMKLAKQQDNPMTVVASDHILSKANNREWEHRVRWYEQKFKDRIYDCVEGY